MKKSIGSISKEELLLEITRLTIPVNNYNKWSHEYDDAEEIFMSMSKYLEELKTEYKRRCYENEEKII